MGCWCSSEKLEDEERSINNKPKVYSWDNKEDIDLSNYMVDGLQKGTAVKLDGDVQGQQFTIQNCRKCVIFVLDHADTVTVDNCEDCKIVIGPVNGSIFLRNCRQCAVAVSCQQFRIRDCENMEFMISCVTQPVIEASVAIKFFPLQMKYDQMSTHLSRAGISPFENHWDNVHDFTPSEDSQSNWQVSPYELDMCQVFELNADQFACGDADKFDFTDTLQTIENAGLSFKREDSVLPVVTGNRGVQSGESCVMSFFYHRYISDDMVVDTVNKLNQSGVSIIKTRKMKLTNDEATRLFIDESPESIVCRQKAQQGIMIGVECNGDDCILKCKQMSQSHQQESGTSDVIVHSTETAQDSSHMTSVFASLYDNKFNF